MTSSKNYMSCDGYQRLETCHKGLQFGAVIYLSRRALIDEAETDAKVTGVC